MALKSSTYLICPTLSLLWGQAAVGQPWVQTLFWTTLLCGLSLLLFRVPGWRSGVVAILCVVAYLWGYGTYARMLYPTLPPHHIALLGDTPRPVLVEGCLYRAPERRQGKTRWFLRVQRVEGQETMAAAEGNVLVTLRKVYREWHYGACLRTSLRLREPRNRGSDFDYRAYLARRRIYRTAYLHNDWQVEFLGSDGTTLWLWVESMRRSIRRFVYRHLSPPAAPLLEALVLGDRGGLSPELVKSFTAVGMTHVLSISGLHVGMLSIWAFFVLRHVLSLSSFVLLRWPVLKLTALASMLPVLLYTALAGGRIPTVRAALMVGVYQIAVLFDRDADSLNSLTLAALIVALLWPGAVVELSFQLSFLAVVFIVWGLRIHRSRGIPEPHPRLDTGWLARQRRSLYQGALVPLLATLGTGPLIAHHFGALSLSGLFANPLLVPLVGLVLVPLGLLTALWSLLWRAPAAWLASCIEPLLSFLASAVRWTAALPMASITLPKPRGWMVVLIYLFLVGVAWYATRRPADRQRINDNIVRRPSR